MNSEEYKKYTKAVNKRFFIGIILGTTIYVSTLIVWAITKTI